MEKKEVIVSFKDVCMYFGGVKAIDQMNFEVEKGKIFGIIGPNGAGKSTLFNVLTGVYIPTAGEIYFKDKLINKMEPHVITGGGIARTFQNIKLFDSETVLDNLKVAHTSHIKYGIADALLKTKKFRQEEQRIEDECMSILKDLGQEQFAYKKAGSLPYGEQRRIEIARALCCRPEVLLLDEPAAGMNPAEVDELNKPILNIRDHYNLTVMVVEHQMRLVMSICDEILGANGAGKTTTLNALTGVLRAKSGTVKGKNILGLPTHKITEAGMIHVPEGRHIFPTLTVGENLRVAAYLYESKNKHLFEERKEYVFEMFPRLKERVNQAGGTLSGGEPQMLAIGRALITGGDILLLDEPSMGIAPKLVLEIFDTIQQIAAGGQTIMLVEQNAMMETDIASYCYVLETGNVSYEGTSAEIKSNDNIVQAYLG